MRFDPRLALATGLAVALSACAPVDPGLGEALAYDKVAQTVNPDPQYPSDGAQPGDDGNHGQKATERYRKGATKPVQVMQTGGGGSSGGGGGSGPK
nr:hypothetical protein [uncultured Sphingomonas sp.]